MKRCGQCDHWREGEPIVDHRAVQIGTMGECHRRAPVVGFNRYGTPITAWPLVDSENGCDDWKEKGEAA